MEETTEKVNKPNIFNPTGRGPFTLFVSRVVGVPTTKKPIPWKDERLPGSTSAWDLLEEVTSLLTDPRDTIRAIYVWSEAEEQFVTTFTRENLP